MIGELIYDLELEKPACRRKQETRRRKERQSYTATESVENRYNMANNQTLRELTAPELTHQPLCITFPTLAENTAFELKSGLIHLLPSFHGLSGEEPHKHVKEFEVACSGMKSTGITEEQIRLKTFPFSLKDAVKNWLYYLPAGSITTWAQLKKKFLEKFFPASRATSLKKEICNIKQYPGESLYDYWEMSTDRSIIDAASGGALANKTPKKAWEFIETMAENSQQFGFRESNSTLRVKEVKTSSIQQQLSELTSVVRQLAMENTQRAKVNMAGSVPALRRQYDPYFNTYNPGWRDHPNFSYGNKPQNSFSNRPSGFQQPWQPQPQPSSSNSGSSLEDIFKSLTTTTTQLQQETRSLVTTAAQLQQETRSLVTSTTQF
nr:uncharacterized protein LOC113724507 [Coffea arabica]